MDPIKSHIGKIVRQKINFSHYRVFIFGSRASQIPKSARSDYDVGIEAPQKIPLFVLGEIRNALDRLPILQKIDLVDFGRVSDKFKKSALQIIEVIYEQ